MIDKISKNRINPILKIKSIGEKKDHMQKVAKLAIVPGAYLIFPI